MIFFYKNSINLFITLSHLISCTRGASFKYKFSHSDEKSSLTESKNHKDW